MDKPTLADIAAGVLLAILLLAIPLAAYIGGKWVIVGSGLVFVALWVWARVETGAWLDSFGDLSLSIRGGSKADPQHSQRQRPARR